ncbi:4-hydroxybenzoate polyprenyltransferase [Cupriavidus metallidurans]|jgi:4-hydroxybenzoate polyprenyltransferase|uniref:4-hydroxybenzoate octaprenyltransferase n=1 Tax=Cupriavidus metallidurans (strain ATCC 43123 / DSM 2839 / NBRC 102507 / CH34) TaxID=266264 RepID=UBIA_CUPMC|nr:4-hydroxybenzoate octaprenyltransferase [Cupriavidus metallidurans]Q1LJ64.1 RecName: Full=4-hydroxybenzoate octaprenyltransferase; AltName: Full=4-HB polyprenyltransferase [Cupriavidus metallidurans CH34]ABF09812.1 p-hydroxybenzoate octaprenyltransferase [Cupriavidus metallidurans CH34]MDE4919341.1 4-hydroxybenzoate octaprenyltransferase [Cupriavidus metallidurans]QGS29361.1 4-hydroxybenzoate octaprenyltransferase [Cupriavidus metallidurans]
MSHPSTAPAHPSRLALYARLVRIDKPIGTLLLLWPTLWAMWMAAGGPPGWTLFWIFFAGTFLMRSAGCAMNDWADRDFDKHVKRTKERPLTAGLIASWEALAVAAVLALIALALILPLNALTKWLAVVAAVLAGTYPFFKRFFAIPQAYLGIAFGFGIPMAFAAIQDQVPFVAWLMLLANVFWAIAYDTAYAMVDRDDDLLLGMKTSAITFGRFDVAAIMICYAVFLGLMAWAGSLLGLGWPYYAGLVAAAGMAGYHYTLIRERDRMKCFAAFRHNNWLGACVFAGTFVAYLLK